MASPVTKKNEYEKTKTRVLLREAVPKYSFHGKKLDKFIEEKKGKEVSIKINQSVSDQNEKSFLNTKLDKSAKPRGNVVPSISVKSNSVKSEDAKSPVPIPCTRVQPNIGSDSSNVKPVNVVNPASSALNFLPTTESPLEQAKQNEVRLTKEVDSLKSQLEVQLQVNSELKRLLLASMGADLERNVERLARDKAQLSLELGDHMKKMTADYENLDKISIQADMWRSKFLASRVMIDELANAKAFYSLQYQESQDALQQMLNERHEIRTNLLEGYRCLQQVKDAFDPLNTHQSTVLPSTNILDLAKRAQQLAEIIRYRLLPASAKVHSVVNVEANWQDRLTPAETLAHEVISKNVSPIDYKYSMPQSLLGSTCAKGNIGRYHPHTAYDNLTYNCCAKCKGEISVL
ncbi:golgin-45 [Patella vulgata]|uniref:golgin-45 n=1 Tax=Patella vulgata TaxID=6465 RepID=UPI0024A99D3A|nr:golgin-45 [Patella vulgata]